MAPKHAIDSDDEDASSIGNSQKRSRTNGTSEPTEPSSPLNTTHASTSRTSTSTGKGKAPASSSSQAPTPAEDDLMDLGPNPNAMTQTSSSAARGAKGGGKDDEDEESEYEENEEEEEEVQRGLAVQVAQAKAAGQVRTAGVMEQLELHNVMCHEYLTIEFNPQINFVIGHNGSGKSAILTAITLVLGGKASTTQRGNSLKEFVKINCHTAMISLRLGNRGAEAFKPSVYGDTITIERTINTDGGGSYKIRGGKERRVISNKKEELSSMLDHFGIMPDSPLCVLSQDNSRQFLAASSSKDKYELFIKGSQLAQLSEDYEAIRNSISTMLLQLNAKRETVPDLLKTAKAARTRFEDAEKAERQGERLGEMRKELAWSYVVEKEGMCGRAEAEVEKEEGSLVRNQERLAGAEATFASIEAEFEECVRNRDAALGQEGNNELEEERDELKRQLKEKHERMKVLNNDMRQVRNSQDGIQKEIAEHQARIEAEEAKLAANSSGSRADALARLTHLRTETEGLAESNRELERELNELLRRKEVVQARQQELHSAVQGKQREYETADANLRRVQGAQSNPLQVYGPNVPDLMAAIERERGWQEKPIGPIGRYVKLKPEAEPYAAVLEAVLNKHLDGFVVTNREDENRLRGLSQTCRCPINITRTRRDLFDYSRGEPDARFTTILRVLSISDEFVKRVLINDCQIERSILLPDRRGRDGADEVMKYPPPNVAHCYVPSGTGAAKIGGMTGGKQSFSIKKTGPPKLSNDLTASLAAARHDKETLEQALRQLNQEAHALKVELDQMARAYQAKRNERAQKERRIGQNNGEISQINDTLAEGESADVQAYLDLKEESQRELQASEAQLEAVMMQKLELEAASQPILRRKEELDKQIDERDQIGAQWNDQMQELVRKRSEASQTIEHHKRQVSRQSDVVDARKQEYNNLQGELQENLAQTYEICGSEERIETRKKPTKLISEMEALTKAIQTAQQRRGAASEEIRTEFTRSQQAYQNAKDAIESLASLVKLFKNSLQLRYNTWHSFRKHIALRARMMFLFHLQRRGFSGQLRFNHDKRTLSIQVNTNNDEQSQRKYKDIKSLSGGEKSFSTISLLLTLWDAVQCPVRCLDEFDVFMDAANRKVAVKMMLDSAKTANQVQYLFITPQDLAGITIGQETSVHRLRDPNRNQQNGQQELNFNH